MPQSFAEILNNNKKEHLQLVKRRSALGRPCFWGRMQRESFPVHAVFSQEAVDPLPDHSSD